MDIMTQARIGLLLTALVHCCGCSMITPSSKMDDTLVLQSSAPTSDYQVVADAQRNNAIVLEVVGAKTPTRAIPLPSDGRPVYVSDLLRQSGLSDQFLRMDAALFRNSPTTVNGVRMGIRFKTGTNQVAPEHDYALQAGDRVRVVELDLNPFESFANMWSLPANGRRAAVGF